MPFTTGLRSRSGVVASADAPPLTLLKKAGAIPLVTTNTSELCMWSESHNHLHGITNNPYHLGRTPGGSSGEVHTPPPSAHSFLVVPRRRRLDSPSPLIPPLLRPPQAARAACWGRRARSSGLVRTSAGAFACRLSLTGYSDIKPLPVRPTAAPAFSSCVFVLMFVC